MLNLESLFRDLEALNLGSWQALLAPLLNDRVSDKAHGNAARWKDIIRQLPAAQTESIAPDGDAVVIGADKLQPQVNDLIRAHLKELMPWRKGPFDVHGIELDSEWRSDMKWRRIIKNVEPLVGRNVLDVGSGNGYYAFRMRNAGAANVIGIDPTLLFVCQFAALKKIAGRRNIHVLPLRLNELPPDSMAFDTTFSMGVLYHQRDPLCHLAQLRDTLRTGGELVLETLILPGDESTVVVPENRYARMRNVWHLPTVSSLIGWVEEAGFANIRIADVTTTTVHEQRQTDWMTFESLAESLDPANPALTIEGLPAPTRAILTCNAP